MEKLIVLTFFLFVLIFPVFGDDYLSGVEAYSRGDYISAVDNFKKYLSTDKKIFEKELMSRAYIGASLFILKEESISTGWFLSLLKLEPEYELNPVYFPPEIIIFFEKIKKEVLPLVFKKEQKHFYLNFLPFGAGQFQNCEYIKGAILAGAEVIALSINLDSYFRRKSMEKGGKYPEDRLSEAKKLQNIQLISGGIFIAGYIYGFIDGSLNYRNKNLSLSLLNKNGVVTLSWEF